MCADVAVSKCVEAEDVENVAPGVVLQCLVELCVCSLVYNCFPFPLLFFTVVAVIISVAVVGNCFPLSVAILFQF